MRFLSRGALAAVFAALAVAVPSLPALAVETSSSELVIIREDTVFPDDLYAGAVRVIVEGTLDGDLFAFAAEEVVINGTVNGSVTAVTPRVVVNGRVEESLQVTGNSLVVAGDVGGDLVAAVVDMRLEASSSVDGEVLAWSWSTVARGTVGEDLTGTFRSLRLGGTVNGDVDVTVAKLEIVDALEVTGDLGYRSDSDGVGLDRAEVGGVVVEKASLAPNIRIRALGVLGRFLVFIMLAVSALTVAYSWPGRTREAIARLTARPLRRWLAGAAVIFSPLVIAAVTGVILGLAPAAAAFPLLAVLLPLTLALVGLVFALSLVAGAPVAGWLGALVSKRLDLYGAIVVGSIVAGVLWFLPILGWVVPVVMLPWGLGAWMATWRRQPSFDP
ncbi:MAG TPA: polymer-forming cytoskeletal protein [Acidimicrobiia bacterium]|nr:polymer-forming cytoskeletal protein [Acidimicrobiia bacterium]